MATKDFSVIQRVALATAVLAIAGIALFLMQKHAPAAPLPDYELSLTGGAQGGPLQLRPDTLRVRPGTRVQIVARPSGPVDGEIAARAFVVEGGAAKTWSAPIEIEAGVVRLAGDAEKIFPAASGDWDVVVAIARPATLPLESTIIGMLSSPVPAVKTVRCRVVVTQSNNPP